MTDEEEIVVHARGVGEDELTRSHRAWRAYAKEAAENGEGYITWPEWRDL